MGDLVPADLATRLNALEPSIIVLANQVQTLTADLAHLRADFSAEVAHIDETRLKLDELYAQVNPGPPPPPPPPPPPVSPSGQAMPTADLPGWKMTWSEDFNTDAAEGEFVAKYPRIAVHDYGNKPIDTSKRGTYDTKNLSVSGSVQRTRIYTDAAGVHHVSVWSPKLPGPGKWGDVSSGRFAIRWRHDVIPTYKVAWLLWPLSGKGVTDGEIDFPERNLDEPQVHGFMHHQGATVGGDQDSCRAAIDATKWHTTVIEWIMGKSCAFILDDVLLKKSTDRVPATPMHWNIQTETNISRVAGVPGYVPVDPKAAGNVEIDWLCYWAPV